MFVAFSFFLNFCCSNVVGLQIALIQHSPDKKNIQTQYPGLYILSDPARFIRSVRNLVTDSVEFIGELPCFVLQDALHLSSVSGTFEQVYLSIVIDPDEAEPGVTMHQELHPSCLFSFAGNLIPFPDHNQSPRYELRFLKLVLHALDFCIQKCLSVSDGKTDDGNSGSCMAYES